MDCIPAPRCAREYRIATFRFVVAFRRRTLRERILRTVPVLSRVASSFTVSAGSSVGASFGSPTVPCSRSGWRGFAGAARRSSPHRRPAPRVPEEASSSSSRRNRRLSRPDPSVRARRPRPIPRERPRPRPHRTMTVRATPDALSYRPRVPRARYRVPSGSDRGREFPETGRASPGSRSRGRTRRLRLHARRSPRTRTMTTPRFARAVCAFAT